MFPVLSVVFSPSSNPVLTKDVSFPRKKGAGRKKFSRVKRKAQYLTTTMMLRGSRPGSMGVDGAGAIGRLLATSLRASHGAIPSSSRKHRNHGRLREGTTSTSSPSSGFGRLPLLWAGSERRACADVSCGSGVRESSAVAGDQGSGATADRFKLKDLEVPGTIRTGANSVGTQVLEVRRALPTRPFRRTRSQPPLTRRPSSHRRPRGDPCRS